MFLDFSEIRKQVELKTYIEFRSGVLFKRVSNDYRANKCLYCGSKTGFSISLSHPDIYHCFSCRNSGDVINYEQDLSNCNQQQAAAIVAGHANLVSIPTKKPAKKSSQKQKDTDQKENPLHQYIWSISNAASKDLLQIWLTSQDRKFGIWADKAADLINNRVRVNDYKDRLQIIVPILNTKSTLLGVQAIGIEDNEKRFHGTSKGIFVFDTGSKEIIFVESFANGLAVACAGYTAIVLFSINNVNKIKELIGKIKAKEEKEFYLWLDKDRKGEDRIAKLQLECLKENPSLKGVEFQADKSSKYDINNLLTDEQEDFPKAVEYHLEQALTYQEIKDIEEGHREKAIEIREVIRSVKGKEILFLNGATGIGKTHQVLIEMVANYQKGEASTLFCSTLTEVDRAYEMLKLLLPQKCHHHISQVVSRKSRYGEDIDLAGTENVSSIALTTYAYLDMKGEIAELYKIAEKLTAGRNIYCDEIHELYRRSLILYPLSARYLLREGGSDRGTYKRFNKCACTAKKGSCVSCYVGYLKESLNANNERNFYRSISEKAFEEHTKPPVFPLTLDWSKSINLAQYKRIISTLFYQSLDFEPTYNLDDFTLQAGLEEERRMYVEYVKKLAYHLYNPHLRIESPLLCKTETNGKKQIKKETVELIHPKAISYLSEEEQKQVKYPVGACHTPFLCGVSLIPYLQLMMGKKVTLMSATTPPHLTEIMGEIAQKKDWKTRQVEIKEVPFKFNIAMLKTSQRLSPDKQAKLVSTVKERLPKEKMFVVTSVKPEAQAVYKALKTTLKNEVELFWREDFISMVEERVYVDGVSAKLVTVTYGRSAITKGVDMPTVTTCIIDVNQFLPQIAIPNIRQDMTPEELRKVSIEHISDNVCQTIGRLLRSLKRRIPGTTQIEERQIVVLLHGLPKELMDFELDPKVLSEYREYRESFVSAIPKHVVESISDAIVACKAGGDPVDRKQVDREITKDKILEKGIEALSCLERNILSENEKTKLSAEKRHISLEQNVAQAAQAGASWRQISRKYNMTRLTKREKAKLKKIFTQTISKK